MIDSKPRTQKATGILALKQKTTFPVPAFNLIQNYKDLENLEKNKEYEFPRFARPCPVTPRHGFVDSRIVESHDQLKKVYKEAIAVDPQAELVIMRPYKCIASSVLTPSQITFGPNHDGATQGYDTLSIPLSGFDTEKLPKKAAGIVDDPYIESLYMHKTAELLDYENLKIVQLRNGPSCRSTGNFIPKDVTVKNVIYANERDLLKWEKMMKEATPGTVVYHGGGSPVSHYSVHAILNNVPVIYDQTIKVGQILKKNVTDNKLVHVLDLKKGIADGLSNTIPSNLYGRMLNIALLGTHHAVSMMSSRWGSYYIGLAASTLLKFGYAACLGESAHFKFGEFRRSHRNSIYSRVFTSNLDEYRPKLYKAYINFKIKENESVGWDDCCGGPKWAICAKSIINLEKNLFVFLNKPNKTNLKKMIGDMHQVVNSMHNNGPFLNKFDLDSYAYQFNTFEGHAEAHPVQIMASGLSCFLWSKQGNKSVDRSSPYFALDGAKKVKFNKPNFTPDALLYKTYGSKTVYRVYIGNKHSTLFTLKGAPASGIIPDKYIKKLPKKIQCWVNAQRKHFIKELS